MKFLWTLLEQFEINPIIAHNKSDSAKIISDISQHLRDFCGEQTLFWVHKWLKFNSTGPIDILFWFRENPRLSLKNRYVKGSVHAIFLMNRAKYIEKWTVKHTIPGVKEVLEGKYGPNQYEQNHEPFLA